MSALQIDRIDPTDLAVRSAIVAYLAPVEQHALFILGNLLSGFPNGHYYVAHRDGHWLGIAGYFPRFSSFTPYSSDSVVARALTAHVARAHGRIEYLNAIASIGMSASEELRRLGYEPANDPRQVLMEAPMPQPPAHMPQEAAVRLARAGEEYAVADLMRLLTRPNDPSQPTAEEVGRQVLNHRYVAEADGRLVATASSNGLAIRCFQILGVVTHPDFRRRGYASATCTALMRAMYEKGARHAVLFTAIDNISAQQCYQRLGFRMTCDYVMAKFRSPTCEPSAMLLPQNQE